MEQIKFVIENWGIIVAFICVVILAVQRIVEFIALPTDKKKSEIKARLLEWVRKAEADLGSGTGEFKLAQVYDVFCAQYPELKKWFTLEQFDSLVNDALDEMKKSFENENAKINALKLQ